MALDLATLHNPPERVQGEYDLKMGPVLFKI
jgi:hypothetical protein